MEKVGRDSDISKVRNAIDHGTFRKSIQESKWNIRKQDEREQRKAYDGARKKRRTRLTDTHKKRKRRNEKIEANAVYSFVLWYVTTIVKIHLRKISDMSDESKYREMFTFYYQAKSSEIMCRICKTDFMRMDFVRSPSNAASRPRIIRNTEAQKAQIFQKNIMLMGHGNSINQTAHHRMIQLINHMSQHIFLVYHLSGRIARMIYFAPVIPFDFANSHF